MKGCRVMLITNLDTSDWLDQLDSRNILCDSKGKPDILMLKTGKKTGSRGICTARAPKRVLDFIDGQKSYVQVPYQFEGQRVILVTKVTVRTQTKIKSYPGYIFLKV